MHDDDIGAVVVRTECSVGSQQLADMICTAVKGFWMQRLQSVFDRHCGAPVLDEQKSSFLLLQLLIHSFDVTVTEYVQSTCKFNF